MQLVHRTLPLLGAALLLAPPTPADTPAAGYEIESLAMPTGVPLGGSVTCTLPDGDIAVFDGTSVTRWTDQGGFVQTIATIPESGFAAFILLKPDKGSVVFAHSGDFFAGVHGEIFQAPLTGAGAVKIVDFELPYDGQFLSNNLLLVSGDTTGQVVTTDIVKVDLVAKTATIAGTVDGPSGPIALRANGDLFYAPGQATFPAPPGSSEIVFWTAAEVAGAFLDDDNYSVWASGYDPIGSMRVDPVKDRVFVAENLYDQTFSLVSARLRRARPNVATAEEIAVAGESISNLEFVNTEFGEANFQAYQPGNGSNLKYNTTDFSSSAQHARVRPLRPVLSVSGPGAAGFGSVTLSVSDAPVNGTLYLFYGLQSQMSPEEETYVHPGYLFHTHLNPGTAKRLPFFLPTDAGGNGSFTLYNPGSLNGLYGYQFLVGDGSAVFLGSTNDVVF
jgi:hypothetical protein